MNETEVPKDIRWRKPDEYPDDMPKGLDLLLFTCVGVIRHDYSDHIDFGFGGGIESRAIQEKIKYWAFANTPQ